MLKPFLAACAMATALVMTGCSTTESMHSSPHASHHRDNMGLYQRQWIATQINGNDIRMDRAAGRNPSIQFDARSHRYFGADGCNQIQGRFESEGRQLRIGQSASTMMACYGRNASISRQYNDALAQTTSYRLRGHELKFLDRSGNVVASFVTVIQPLP